MHVQMADVKIHISIEYLETKIKTKLNLTNLLLLHMLHKILQHQYLVLLLFYKFQLPILQLEVRHYNF